MYEAVDPMIGRRVAIKTVSLHVVADEETRARFFREAQAAGQLSHPNLITIHDIGDADGTPFIVMEFLEGLDLSREIRQKRLSYRREDPAHDRGVSGPRIRARPRHRPPRHQARQHLPHHDRTHEDSRFRVGARRDFGAHPDRKDPRNAELHGARADPRRGRRSPGRHLCDGRGVLRVAQRTKGLRRRFGRHNALQGARDAAAADHPARRAAAGGLVGRHRSSAGEGSRCAFSDEPRDARCAVAGGRPERARRPIAAADNARESGRRCERPPPRRMPPAVGWALAGVIVAGVAGMALWTKRAANSANETIPPRPAAQTEARQLPPPAAPPQMPPVETTPASPSGGAILPAPADDKKATKPAIEKPPAAEGKRASSGSASRVTAPPEPAPVTKVLPAPPPPVTAPPTTVTTVTTVPPPEPAAAPIHSPRVTSPPVTPPQPPPATRRRTAAGRVEESPTAAAQAVLARYRAALEARDIGALKRIWPSLSGRQEEAHEERIRAIARDRRRVSTASPLRPTSSGATLTCRRSYAVTTADGHTLSTATTMIMTLARRDGVWSIDTIRHEVAR